MAKESFKKKEKEINMKSGVSTLVKKRKPLKRSILNKRLGLLRSVLDRGQSNKDEANKTVNGEEEIIKKKRKGRNMQSGMSGKVNTRKPLKKEFFKLNYIGEESCLTVPFEDRCPLVVQDTYSLVRQAVMRSYKPQRSWCDVKKCSVVAIIVDGIAIGDLKDLGNANKNLKDAIDTPLITNEENKGKGYPQLRKYRQGPNANEPRWLINSLQDSASCFPIRLEVQRGLACQDTLLRDIIDADASEASSFMEQHHEESTRQRTKNILLNKPESAWHDDLADIPDAFDRRNLLLSLKAMSKTGYPLPYEDSPFGSYKYTKDKYAEVVYTSFVKPDNKIIDFITRYSGVLPKDIQNCRTRLADVQYFLREFLPPDAILVGHSLDNDLHALQMMHPYVIDTSIIYNISGRRGARASLKLCTKLFLQKDIQSIKSKHHPTEDATATLKLLLLKLKNDVRFGDAIKRGHIPFSDEEQKGCRKVELYMAQKRHASNLRCDDKVQINSKFDKILNTNSIFYLMSKRDTRDFRIVTSHRAKNKFKSFLPMDKQDKIVTVKNCPFEILSNIQCLERQMDLQMVYIPVFEDNDSKLTTLRKLDKGLQDLHSRLQRGRIIMFVLFTGSSTYEQHDRNRNGCLMIEALER